MKIKKRKDMSAPISVVIPTLNAERVLPTCLAALMPGVVEGLIKEVILVDAGSDDATVEIGKEAGATIIQHPPSRGGQLRAGAAAARGEWILALHADSVLDPVWPMAFKDRVDPDKAYYAHLSYGATGVGPKVVAAWANLRSRLFSLPYGDQGLLLHKDLYNKVGGYPDQPLMEDVAIALALRGHLRPFGIKITTSFEKYQKRFWWHQGARNILMLCRYLFGTDAAKLNKLYRK